MTWRSNHRARERRASRSPHSAWAAGAVLALAITADDVGAQLAWNEVPPAGIRAASNAAMAFDAARGRMMLFGGGDINGPIAQTLQWEGTRWLQLSPASSPSAREGHDMAYDAARQRIVLFGGGRSIRSDETWEWDGTNWTKAAPASRPSARTSHAMVYGRRAEPNRPVRRSRRQPAQRHLGVRRCHLDAAVSGGQPAGALESLDGLRRGAGSSRFVRRERHHRARRHVGVRRQHLDPALSRDLTLPARECGDGLRFGERQHGPVRRMDRREPQPRDVGVGRIALATARAGAESGVPPGQRSCVRPAAPGDLVVRRLRGRGTG